MAGSSSYPGGLDSFVNPIGSNGLNNPPHAAQHDKANDAVESIQNTLGINPQGTDQTLSLRLARIDASDPNVPPVTTTQPYPTGAISRPAGSLDNWTVAMTTRIAKAYHFGDSTAMGISGNANKGTGGTGCSSEWLRDFYSLFVTDTGYGYFGLWRREWTPALVGTGTAATTRGTAPNSWTQIPTTSPNDLTPWGNRTAGGGTYGGGGYEATALATNVLTFTVPTASSATQFKLYYANNTNTYGTGSYRINGGAWVNLTVNSATPTLGVVTVNSALVAGNTVEVRAADAAGVAHAFGFYGISLTTASTGTGVLINNMGNSGAHLDDLVYTSSGKPHSLIWNEGADLLILGPFTNEIGNAPPSQTVENKLARFIKAYRTRSVSNATLTGTGNRTISSATAAFDSFSDVGKPVSGIGIPSGTTIASVTSSGVATLSQDCTAHASPDLAVTITAPCTPDILIIGQFYQDRSGAGTSDWQASQTYLRQQFAELATLNNAAFLDMGLIWYGTGALNYTGGYLLNETQKLHPTLLGHESLGSWLFGILAGTNTGLVLTDPSTIAAYPVTTTSTVVTVPTLRTLGTGAHEGAPYVHSHTLAGLTNVNINSGSLVTNQTLQWNAAQNKWVNVYLTVTIP